MRFYLFKFFILTYFIITSSVFCQSPTPLADSQINNNKKPSPQNLIFILERAGIFEVFLSALRQVGLEEKLTKAEIYTVFAPSDAAFSHVGSISREELFSSKPLLKKFVERHIAVGRLSLADLSKMDSITSISGSVIPIEQKEPLEIGHAGLLQTDIIAENGLVHILAKATLVE